MTKRADRDYFTDAKFPVLIDWYSGRASGAPQTTYHEELELQFYFGGTGSCFVGGRTYAVERKSVLVAHKNEVHSYAADPGSFLDRAILVLGSSILKKSPVSQSVANNLSRYHYLVLTEREAVDVEYCLRVMREECRVRAPHWDTVICRHIERILVIMDRARDRESPVVRRETPFVKEVVSYVEDHLSEKLTLARVASHLYISPGFFSRSFKKQVGLGFQEYLIHRRVLEARKLLASTDLKIAAVARKVGFADVSTFNRDFKLLTNFTPSAYRAAYPLQDGQSPQEDG